MHEQNWQYIEIRPPNGHFNGIGQDAGFAPAKSFYLHRLDLRPSLPEIFLSLDKDSVQRRIRRAENSGITYGCGRSEALLKDFYSLFVLTRRRHHLPPQPYAWFRNLVDCMGEALDIRLAYKDASPIATVLTVRFRNTVYYKYGASDQKHHNLAAMPALLWRTIQEAKQANAEEFDLGRSDSDGQGLIAFKDHWTRGRSRLVYWRYPAQGHLLERNARTLKFVTRPFSYMPDRLLVLAGRAIYRHVG
jgi:lipid II:glycine glycyltransferase (peptidoglycan interpeptide bridge formation enzyme)